MRFVLVKSTLSYSFVRLDLKYLTNPLPANRELYRGRIKL